MQSKVISLEMLARGPIRSYEGAAQGVLSGILPVYKKYGETPLECLNRLRLKFPALKDAILSYAGRLDPLAEGVMLVLVGREINQNRRAYLQLEKEYEVEILFGLSSDTGDMLGMPKQTDLKKSNLGLADMKQAVEGFKGRQHFQYPVFSSRAVKGKPLFEWAKEGRLKEIVIPETDIDIHEISVINAGSVTAPVFAENLKKSVGLISGDFRQKEILSAWDEIFIKNISKTDNFITCGIKVRCSSGSYMRTLAEEIGKRLGVPALAYSIRRTKMGEIGISEAYIVN